MHDVSSFCGWVCAGGRRAAEEPKRKANPAKDGLAGTKEAAEKLGNLDKVGGKRPSGAKAQVILLALSARLKSRPDTKFPQLTAKMSFSARRGE